MITQLLDDAYAPITSEIEFLECNADIAASAYTEWQNRLDIKGIEVTEVCGDFPTKLKSVLPLITRQPTRILFMPTANRWTAYFENSWRGNDPSAVSYLSRAIGCRTIRAAYIPHSYRKVGNGYLGRYGAVIFELYVPHEVGPTVSNTRRSIVAMNDGGRWIFKAYGEPFEFEDLQQYQARKMRDRFTPEMLSTYLGYFDIRFFDASFYEAGKPAYLINRQFPNSTGGEEYSLEKVRSQF